MRYFFIIILFPFLLTNFCYSQVSAEKKQLLNSLYEHYKNIPSFHYQVRYDLYKGFEGTQAIESYTGMYQKSDEGIYQKIGEVEVLYKDAHTLKVDHKSKVMKLSRSVVTVEDMFGFKMNDFLDMCDSVIFLNHPFDGYSCIFNVKSFSSSPYVSLRVDFDKSLNVEKFVYYYAQKIDFSNHYNEVDYDQVRLEVSFKGFETKEKNKNLLNFENYLVKDKKLLKPVEKYGSYTLYNIAEKFKL